MIKKLKINMHISFARNNNNNKRNVNRKKEKKKINMTITNIRKVCIKSFQQQTSFSYFFIFFHVISSCFFFFWNPYSIRSYTKLIRFPLFFCFFILVYIIVSPYHVKFKILLLYTKSFVLFTRFVSPHVLLHLVFVADYHPERLMTAVKYKISNGLIHCEHYIWQQSSNFVWFDWKKKLDVYQHLLYSSIFYFLSYTALQSAEHSGTAFYCTNRDHKTCYKVLRRTSIIIPTT